MLLLICFLMRNLFMTKRKTAVTVTATQEPGRMSSKSFHNNDPTSSRNNINFQSEREFQGHCTDRANKGYNSGMGEIFRKVANISPVPLYSNSNEINTNKKTSCKLDLAKYDTSIRY